MITFSLRFNLPSSLISSSGGNSCHFHDKTLELKISNRQTDEEIGNITLDFGIPSSDSPSLSSRSRVQVRIYEFRFLPNAV